MPISKQKPDGYRGPVMGRSFVLPFSTLLLYKVRRVQKYNVYGLKRVQMGINCFIGDLAEGTSFFRKKNSYLTAHLDV